MWLEVDEDLPEHPKSLRLCATLMNPLGWAYVIKLWRWCCKFAPTGDLSDFSAEEIEIGLGWTLDAGVLYAALKRAGFIEDTENGGVAVHDWMEHQGAAIKKMDKDAKRKRNWRRNRPRDVQRTSAGRPRNVRGTARVPNLTKPNPTQPDQTGEPELSPRPADRSSGTPVAEFCFPCDGAPDRWWVTQEQIVDWEASFPSLNIPAQCREALAWVKASPERRKTVRGMAKFLVGWFARSQNRGGQRAGHGSRIDRREQEHRQMFEQGEEWAAGK